MAWKQWREWMIWEKRFTLEEWSRREISDPESSRKLGLRNDFSMSHRRQINIQIVQNWISKRKVTPMGNVTSSGSRGSMGMRPISGSLLCNKWDRFRVNILRNCPKCLIVKILVLSHIEMLVTSYRITSIAVFHVIHEQLGEKGTKNIRNKAR